MIREFRTFDDIMNDFISNRNRLFGEQGELSNKNIFISKNKNFKKLEIPLPGFQKDDINT